MLQVETQFPFPGSVALHQGLRYRVYQHNADGTATLFRAGIASPAACRAPLDELIDPVEADANAIIAITDMSESTARIAIYTAGLLRDVNEVALRALGLALSEAANTGRIPRFTDNSHLVRVMRRLGWRKDGYLGEGYARSPRYVRAATRERAA